MIRIKDKDKRIRIMIRRRTRTSTRTRTMRICAKQEYIPWSSSIPGFVLDKNIFPSHHLYLVLC